MKKLKNLLLVIALILFNVNLFSQVTATANASATIITPIAISKTADMNFGNVAVSTSLGSVILTPAGSRSSTGGVSLPASAGTVAAAAFTVTGATDYTFSITLPAAALTIDDGASNTMTVSSFTSTPTPTGTLTGGSVSLSVGATLNVGASQVAGVYTSDTPFDVIVNYN